MNIQPYNPRRSEPQTGVVRGEPNDVYHASGAVGSSALHEFWNNPQRFRAKRAGEIEEERKACLDLGDLFHVVCLENVDTWQSRFVLDTLEPERPTATDYKAFANNSGKELKGRDAEAQERRRAKIEKHEAFWRHHDGKTLVKAETDQTARAMRDAMFRDRDAGPMLRNFEAMETELTCRTEPLAYGFAVQARIDAFDTENRRMIDLKSVRDLDVFSRHVAQFGYYRQAAFYLLVFERVTGLRVDEFVFVAVESGPPHEVAVFTIDPDDIERGTNEIIAGLQRLSDAIRTDVWPKRYPGFNVVSLRPWDRERSDARLEGGTHD